MSPRKKIVFLGVMPLSKRDYERFGFDYLKKNNLEVFYLECNFLVKNVSLNESYFAAMRLEHFPGSLVATSVDEAINLINEYKFEFVIDLYDEIPRGEAIILSARKYGKHIKLRLGNAPFHFAAPVKINKMTRILRELKSPVGLIYKLINKTKLFYFRKYTIQKKPDLYLVGGIKSFRGIDSEKIIYGHNLDYDLIQHEKPFNGGYSVFLDEDMPFHQDFLYFNIAPPVTPEIYYHSLNKFLADIGENRKEKIVIALHPRAQSYRSSTSFHFEVIQNRVAELVRGASLVIAHSSTSIQLAVIYRKPMLLITTNEIEMRPDVRMAIRAFQEELGCPVLNIDKPYCLKNIKLTVDDLKYKNYFENYIKSSKSKKNEKVWKIFLDYINLNA